LKGFAGATGTILVFATNGTLDTIFAFFLGKSYTASWRRISVCSLPFCHLRLSRTPYWQDDIPGIRDSEEFGFPAIEGSGRGVAQF
jgi:hypothetical protein